MYSVAIFAPFGQMKMVLNLNIGKHASMALLNRKVTFCLIRLNFISINFVQGQSKVFLSGEEQINRLMSYKALMYDSKVVMNLSSR